MDKLKVKIKKLHPDAIIPKYQTNGSSGFDFHALEDIDIVVGQTVLVPTGLSFDIPDGYEIQVRPRSGLSLKTNLRVNNSPGTIDADFRGQVCIIISHIFTGDIQERVYTIKKGDRIAQGVICPVFQAEFVEEELSETERGSGGFGSTKGN